MPLKPFTVYPADSEQSFFRLLAGDAPTLQDFYSDETAGKLVDQENVPNWAEVRGFSVRATLTQMSRLGRHLGRSHIAEIRLNGEDGSAYARTGRTPGHHTIWASADKVLAEHVKEVHPLIEDER